MLPAVHGVQRIARTVAVATPKPLEQCRQVSFWESQHPWASSSGAPQWPDIERSPVVGSWTTSVGGMGLCKTGLRRQQAKRQQQVDDKMQRRLLGDEVSQGAAH